ncbi:Carbon-nitrogen hydrolase [Linnemannia gamsii]|uniref:Carbon-nitrogen hydrolase n=1 Tax=Linnemannia gamsii TaxID=64522 RepID=A0ABQ7JVG4_9FUNG|nr:Carbon-nitrogen hydrolase [Linnemannia gamsii]
MKIACLQFAPILGEVQRNIDHATSMIAELKPEDVDVLVLPEMAFSGYVFTSKDHVRPYLEDAESGPSVQWAKAQAIRLNAHVQVGYPEKRVVNRAEPFKEEYYNSIAFVSPQGVLVKTYAKHFLYYTDENWAEEGPSFESVPVEGLGQVGFGICMDVNPYQFKAPFSDFEFASYHFGQKTNLLLCSMAWNKGDEAPKKEKVVPKPKSAMSKARLEKEHEQQGRASESATDPRVAEAGANDGAAEKEDEEEEEDEEWEDEEDEEELERQALELQYETIHYWALRMSPFYKQAAGKGEPFLETHLAIANRLGTESGRM